MAYTSLPLHMLNRSIVVTVEQWWNGEGRNAGYTEADLWRLVQRIASAVKEAEAAWEALPERPGVARDYARQEEWRMGRIRFLLELARLRTFDRDTVIAIDLKIRLADGD